MKKRIVSAICFLAVFSQLAYAAPIETVEEDIVTGNIKITGDFSGKSKYSIQLLEPGVDYNSMNAVTDDVIMDKVAGLVAGESKTGKYSEEIVMKKNAVSGTYTITVNSVLTGTPVRKTIKWFVPADIATAFQAYKDSVSAGDVKTFIENELNCDKLGVDFELLANLSNAEITGISDSLFAAKGSILNVDDFRKKFVTLAAPKAVNAATAPEKARDIIISNASKLEIENNDTYLSFKNENDNYQLTASRKLKNSGISDVATLISKLKEAMVLAGIECSASAADVSKIMKNNQGLFSSKISEYFLSKNTYSIDNEISGKAFSSIDDIETRIKNIIDANKSQTGGNGGSGGGGGGGKGNNPVPPKGSQDAAISIPVDTSNNKAAFTDLDDASWAAAAITALYEKNIVSGKGEGIFDPLANVKREEFVKMVINAFETDADGDVPFSDVLPNAWYYPYIKAAYNSGMVNGVSKTQFGIGKNITREDMTVLVYRFLSKECELPKSEFVEFTDKADISEYAREAVAVLREAGIVSGMSDGSFKPKEKCTRAQVAYIIYKSLKYAGKM